MANKILIKSGNGAPADGVLDTAELGFDKTNNKLYIGNNGSVIDLIGIDWFKKGVTIPSNSDLNNYNTPGKYTVSSTSVSKTILNSPVTNDNFVLFVFARTTSNSTSLTQMIISLGSSLYIRNNNSSGAWRDWVRYAKASEAITDLSASGQTITYTKGDGTTGTVTTTTSSATTADRLINYWVEGSVLDFALSCPVGLTNFVTSTDTTDLPDKFSNYNYGTGYVMKRSDNFIYIELHPYNASSSPVARNTYNGTWYGWIYDYSEANKPTASDVGAVPTSRTVNGKALSSDISLSANDVSALPASGGTLTGDLSINNSILLSSSSQGGNIQIIPPSSYSVNYWEADAYNGNLRIFAQNSDGSYVFPLTLRSDGGMGIGGNLFINNNCYGTSLPAAGSTGRIFFKKVT